MRIKISNINLAKKGKRAGLIKSEHEKFHCITNKLHDIHFKPITNDSKQVKKGIQRLIKDSRLDALGDSRIVKATSLPELGEFRPITLTEIKTELNALCMLVENVHIHNKPKLEKFLCNQQQ